MLQPLCVTLLILHSLFSITLAQYGPGLPPVPGSPYVSSSFGMTVTITGPDFLPVNGKIGYTPWLSSVSLQTTGPMTFQLIPPHSADNDILGCSTYNHITTDDGTPIAGSALMLSR